MDTVIRDEKLTRTGFCLISWTAVIAGALIAFSLSALLNLLNAGLGLMAFPQNYHSMAGVTAGGYIWLILCGVIAMLIAGWVTGRIVRNQANACHGLLHGFLAWSLALLVSLFLASHFAVAAAEALDKTTASTAVERPDATRVMDHDTTTPNEAARAEQAADNTGTATIGLFLVLLLGAIAACVGGYLGAKSDGPLANSKF